MASYTEFDPKAVPVLSFRPSRPAKSRKDGRLFLLWPAYGYRVLAPKAVDKKLNIFQKSVLGFCRAGITDHEKIAARLHLDKEVVKYVQGEMRHGGMLNPDLTLTSLGQKILSDEFDRLPTEIVPGYVFQDPWQGKLWPRFVERLEFAQTELGPNGYPILIFGTEGKPRRKRPLVKHTDARVMPHTPTPVEIIRACRRHVKEKNRQQFFEVEANENITDEDDDDFDPAIAGINTFINSISFINEKPEQFYLSTFIYFPPGNVRSSDWFAFDPFGLGPSMQMRRWIDLQLSEDRYLKEKIDSFIIDHFGDGNQYDSLWNTIDQLAQDEVTSKLGDWIRVFPFFDLLVAMERTNQETKQYTEEVPKDKFEDVLVKMGKALESLFRFIHDKYPTPSAHEIYNLPSRINRKAVLDEIAVGLGYATPLPYGLSGVSPEEVRRSNKTGGGTLSERLVVAILAARQIPDHPLACASSQIPDLFERLSILTKLRGQSAHETELEITRSVAEMQLAETYHIIQVLTSFISSYQ